MSRSVARAAGRGASDPLDRESGAADGADQGEPGRSGPAPGKTGRAGWRVEKARVLRAFGEGAAHYDAHASVQRRAADRLLELIGHSLSPRRILDVGAGTGALLARLEAGLPSAHLCAVDLAPGMARVGREAVPRAAWVVGEAEGLPVRRDHFDLVLSTSALQWLPRLDGALAEAARVAAPGGLVAIALFGGSTLWELREAWRAAVPPERADGGHRFHDLAALGDAARAAGLELQRLCSERLVEHHPEPLALLRALKRLGAGNASGGAAAAGFNARARLARMSAHYRERHGDALGIPATWEVLYFVGRKGAG